MKKLKGLMNLPKALIVGHLLFRRHKKFMKAKELERRITEAIQPVFDGLALDFEAIGNRMDVLIDKADHMPVLMLDEFGDWQIVPTPVVLGHQDD